MPSLDPTDPRLQAGAALAMLRGGGTLMRRDQMDAALVHWIKEVDFALKGLDELRTDDPRDEIFRALDRATERMKSGAANVEGMLQHPRNARTEPVLSVVPREAAQWRADVQKALGALEKIGDPQRFVEVAVAIAQEAVDELKDGLQQSQVVPDVTDLPAPQREASQRHAAALGPVVRQWQAETSRTIRLAADDLDMARGPREAAAIRSELLHNLRSASWNAANKFPGFATEDDRTPEADRVDAWRKHANTKVEAAMATASDGDLGKALADVAEYVGKVGSGLFGFTDRPLSVGDMDDQVRIRDAAGNATRVSLAEARLTEFLGEHGVDVEAMVAQGEAHLASVSRAPIGEDVARWARELRDEHLPDSSRPEPTTSARSTRQAPGVEAQGTQPVSARRVARHSGPGLGIEGAVPEGTSRSYHVEPGDRIGNVHFPNGGTVHVSRGVTYTGPGTVHFGRDVPTPGEGEQTPTFRDEGGNVYDAPVHIGRDETRGSGRSPREDRSEASAERSERPESDGPARPQRPQRPQQPRRPQGWGM